MTMGFDIQFLMDFVRRLASLYYVQQHRRERVLALEVLVREWSEQRQLLDEEIASSRAQLRALHDAQSSYCFFVSPSTPIDPALFP